MIQRRGGPVPRSLLGLGWDWRRGVPALSALLVAFGCQPGVRNAPTDGETHFLSACSPLGDTCGQGLVCLCGLCSLPCEETAACQELSAAAECIVERDEVTEGTCSEPPASGFCDVRCASHEECQGLSAAHRCSGGYCRAAIGPGPSEPDGAGGVSNDGGAAGASGSMTPNGWAGGAAGASGEAGGGGVVGAGGAAGGGGEGGEAGSGCPHGDVAGNEVLVLGDIFIAQSHQITAYLESLAREAGALTAGERYRDQASVTDNGFVTGQTFLADQYAAGQAEGPVRVVIMAGGGADLLAQSCDTDPPTPDCPLMVDITAAADELLVEMARNRVEHIVWFFYPDPVDLQIRAEMDVLRPLLQELCQDSVVPCHWVDLRPAFEDHYDEYMVIDGIPTALGSEAAAGAIWSTMQQECVAQ